MHPWGMRHCDGPSDPCDTAHEGAWSLRQGSWGELYAGPGKGPGAASRSARASSQNMGHCFLLRKTLSSVWRTATCAGLPIVKLEFYCHIRVACNMQQQQHIEKAHRLGTLHPIAKPYFCQLYSEDQTKVMDEQDKKCVVPRPPPGAIPPSVQSGGLVVPLSSLAFIAQGASQGGTEIGPQTGARGGCPCAVSRIMGTIPPPIAASRA